MVKENDMIVKEVLNSLLLADLLILLNDNKHTEVDCSKEKYISNVINNMYLNQYHRITILYDDYKPVGYFILRRDNNLMNELTVIDIYIMKSHQGKQNIQLLLHDATDTIFKCGAKRIKWQSYIFDTDFWDNHTFGLPIESYKMFYINLDDKTKDIYKNKRSKK